MEFKQLCQEFKQTDEKLTAEISLKFKGKEKAQAFRIFSDAPAFDSSIKSKTLYAVAADDAPGFMKLDIGNEKHPGDTDEWVITNCALINYCLVSKSIRHYTTMDLREENVQKTTYSSIDGTMRQLVDEMSETTGEEEKTIEGLINMFLVQTKEGSRKNQTACTTKHGTLFFNEDGSIAFIPNRLAKHPLKHIWRIREKLVAAT